MPDMRLFKSKNTKLELRIRRPLFARGFRYRLHNSGLPGRPDMYFPKYNAVIFIHGCFGMGMITAALFLTFLKITSPTGKIKSIKIMREMLKIKIFLHLKTSAF